MPRQKPGSLGFGPGVRSPIRGSGPAGCARMSAEAATIPSPVACRNARRSISRSSDSLASAMLERALEHLHVVPQVSQIRVDGERAVGIVQRALVIFEPHVNQHISGQRTEMIWIALHHLIAIRERTAKFAG